VPPMVATASSPNRNLRLKVGQAASVSGPREVVVDGTLSQIVRAFPAAARAAFVTYAVHCELTDPGHGLAA